MSAPWEFLLISSMKNLSATLLRCSPNPMTLCSPTSKSLAHWAAYQGLKPVNLADVKDVDNHILAYKEVNALKKPGLKGDTKAL